MTADRHDEYMNCVRSAVRGLNKLNGGEFLMTLEAAVEHNNEHGGVGEPEIEVFTAGKWLDPEELAWLDLPRCILIARHKAPQKITVPWYEAKGRTIDGAKIMAVGNDGLGTWVSTTRGRVLRGKTVEVDA